MPLFPKQENSPPRPAINASTDAILAIADVKGYVRVITLLTQDEVNLLQQLNTCSKQTIKWKKYRSGITKMKTTI